MTERRPPIDARKVALVGHFLRQICPGDEVIETYDYDRSAQFYWIGLATALVHRIFVSKEFSDDHTEEQIIQLFDDWRAAEIIGQAGARAVLVTNGGISVVGTKLGNGP